MKKWICCVLIFTFGFGCVTTLGRNVSSSVIAAAPLLVDSTPDDEDAEVKQVKDAIAALEKIDKDPTIPASIKQRNTRSLQKRRSELLVLLQRQIDRLEAYRDKLKATPGSLVREVKEIEDDIANLKKDLDAATVASGSGAPGISSQPEPRIVQPPVTGPVVTIVPGTLPGPNSTPPAGGTQPATNVVGGTTAPVVTIVPRTQTVPGPAASATGTQLTAGAASPAAVAAQSVPLNCTGYKDNPKAYSIADRYACHLAGQVADRSDKILDARFDSFAIALAAIAKKDRPAYLVEAEEKRVDKQMGAGPSNMGTTSLTVKGSGPEILGLAVENGALTQSMTGTTVTFRGNPLGIIQALANKGYIESYDQSQQYALTRFLKNLSFSFSFDTSRGNQTTETTVGTPMPNVFTADRQQLSEVTARYEIYNQRDPRNKRYRGDWERFLDSQANLNLLDASYVLFTKLTVDGDGSVTVTSNGTPHVLILPSGIPINNQKLITDQLTGKPAKICVQEIDKQVGDDYVVASFDVAPYVTGAPITTPRTFCGDVNPASFKAPGKFATRFIDPALEEWYEKAQDAIQKATDAQRESTIKAQLEALPVDKLDPQTLTTMRNVSVGLEAYRKAKQDVVDKINRGGIVTFEYTNTRNVNAPNLSNFRLIAEKGAGGGFDATFNGSVTTFDKIPVGMTKRIRDFQFSGQADAILGSVGAAGNLVLSFSGRFERLMENGMTPDGMMVMNTKGDIAVGQIKLTIPIKSMGIKFPISVTFANRTELIKEKEVRGNFGFTFDLDSLFAKLKQ